jgi:hypothetical protein
MDQAELSPPVPPRSANSIGLLSVVPATMVIYTHAHYFGGFSDEPLMRWTNGGLNAGTRFLPASAHLAPVK